MRRRFTAVIIPVLSAALLAGCSAKRPELSGPESYLKSAAAGITEFVDADSSVYIKGEHQGFMRQKSEFSYRAEEKYQSPGSTAMVTGTVDYKDGGETCSDTISRYIEADGNKSRVYYNYEGTWEYADASAISETAYMQALLNPDAYKNLAIHKAGDSGEIVVSGTIDGDKLYDTMKKSVSLSDYFGRTNAFREPLKEAEYAVEVSFDEKTGVLKRIQSMSTGSIVGSENLAQFQQTIRFTENAKKPDPETLKAPSDVRQQSETYGNTGDYTEDAYTDSADISDTGEESVPMGTIPEGYTFEE